LQRIRSKHVVQIFDLFLNESDRKVGIVQEYISGEDLVHTSENKLLSVEEYLKILYQISSGISDIHDQGLIHRDIKLNNIKVDESNIVKIFDFGLARVENKNDSTLGFRGTIGFAAPELYQSGLVSFTNAVDTYAFGITAWYLSGEKVPETLLKMPLNNTKTRSFSSLKIDIPDAIVSLLDRSISENPSDRPLMSEIKALLGKYLLRGKHRALIIYGTKTYVLEKIDQVIKLDVHSHGSLHIKYDGLNFLVEVAIGSIFANNKLINRGQLLPKNCVITLGDTARGADRLFVTFDISNPEVVL
jgi:eukaryotic-like serine/threonine-protein kinase